MLLGELLAGPFYLAAMSLVIGGVGKIRRPLALSISLSRAGLSDSFLVVRGIGIVELGIGAAALVSANHVSTALVAALFGVFTLYVAWLVAASVPDATCGCSGKQELRASLSHSLLNLTLAALCVVAWFAPPPSIPEIFAMSHFATPIILLDLTLAYVAMQSFFEYFPRLYGAYRWPQDEASNTAEGMEGEFA